MKKPIPILLGFFLSIQYYGAPWTATNGLRISDDQGNAIYWTGQSSGKDRGEIQLRFSPQEMQQIRYSIKKNRLWSLKDRYQSGMLDGTKINIVLEEGKKKKEIQISNKSVKRVEKFTADLNQILATKKPGGMELR